MPRFTLKLDERTTLLYDGGVLPKKQLQDTDQKWIHLQSCSPEIDYLVHHLASIPLELVRDSNAGDLVLRVDVDRTLSPEVAQARQTYPHVPPYSAIVLTPTEGRLSGIHRFGDGSGVNFKLLEATPDHITFGNLANNDVTVRVNYAPQDTTK